MFQIRPVQMTVLAEVTRRELELRAIAELRAKHGDVAGLEELVEEGMSRAAAAGFVLERDLLDYLDLAAMLGSEFAASDVRRVLEQQRLSPGARVRIAREMLRERG